MLKLKNYNSQYKAQY